MPLPKVSMVSRIRALIGQTLGQGTVEAALVLFAFVALMAGLAALWHAFDSGKVIEHALSSAPQHIAGATGAWVDVFAC